MTTSAPNSKMHLTDDNLKLLRQISPKSMVSAIHGAAINGDFSSMSNAVKFLSGSVEGNANTKTPCGKDLMAGEFSVQAYKYSPNGKAELSREKLYLLDILLSPLRSATVHQLKTDNGLKSYVDDITKALKILKINPAASAAAINSMLLSPVKDELRPIVQTLLRKSSVKDLLIGAFSPITFQSHGKESGSLGNEMDDGRKIEVLKAISSDGKLIEEMRSTLDKWIEGKAEFKATEVRAPMLKEFGKMVALATDPAAGISSEVASCLDMFRQDIFMIDATWHLERGVTKNRHGTPNKSFPNLDGKPDLVSADDYMRAYSLIKTPVSDAFSESISKAACKPGVDKEMRDKSIELVQERIDREGGKPVWVSMQKFIFDLEGVIEQNAKKFREFILAHPSGKPQHYSEALVNLAKGLDRALNPSEASKAIEAIAPALLAAGAHHDAYLPMERDSKRNFTFAQKIDEYERKNARIEIPETRNMMQAAVARQYLGLLLGDKTAEAKHQLKAKQ